MRSNLPSRLSPCTYYQLAARIVFPREEMSWQQNSSISSGNFLSPGKKCLWGVLTSTPEDVVILRKGILVIACNKEESNLTYVRKTLDCAKELETKFWYWWSRLPTVIALMTEIIDIDVDNHDELWDPLGYQVQIHRVYCHRTREELALEELSVT